MAHESSAESPLALANSFAAADIAAILRENSWLDPAHEADADAALQAWLARAAELLGPHAADRAALASLLARCRASEEGVCDCRFSR